MAFSVDPPKNSNNAKLTMVNVFYNEDPHTELPLINLDNFQDKTLKAMIQERSLTTLNDVFDSYKYKDRVKFNMFKNLPSNKFVDVLRHSRKYVYWGFEKSKYGAKSDPDTQPNAELENMFIEKPEENNDIHANVYIFVGGLTCDTIMSKGIGGISALTLATGELLPINEGIFQIFRARGCNENKFKNSKPKLLLFIFLSTREAPRITLQTGGYLDNFEAWVLHSKYADPYHGFSSVEAISGLKNADFTQSTGDLWQSLYTTHLPKASYHSYHHVGYTHDNRLICDNNEKDIEDHHSESQSLLEAQADWSTLTGISHEEAYISKK